MESGFKLASGFTDVEIQWGLIRLKESSRHVSESGRILFVAVAVAVHLVATASRYLE